MRNERSLIATVVVTVLLAALAVGWFASGARPQLGLDLRGGISAVYTPVLPEGQPPPEDFDAVLDQTISVIRQRVNSLGVAEPDITRQGSNIVVQLPGLSDVERAQAVIGRTAQLRFRPVEEVLLPGSPGYDEGPDCDAPVDQREPLPADEAGIVCEAPSDDDAPVDQPSPDADGSDDATADASPQALADAAAQTDASPSPTATATTGASPDPSPVPSPGATPTPQATPTAPIDPSAQVKYRVGPAALTGDAIEDAFPQLSPDGGWTTAFELDDAGAQAFARITAELACQRDEPGPPRGLLAIVLDGVVESAPPMAADIRCGVGITGGQATITSGAATAEEQRIESQNLALVLQTGALPITLEPSTFTTVSPTLGAESLEAGLIAGLIGLALVIAWFVFFYRWLGLVVVGSLAIFGAVALAVITALGEVGFALTLPGIAGFVISIGIAADTSVIFFERIRDEVELGKTVRSAVRTAYPVALRTTLTGNTVAIAAAVILYFLAVGPVRGFALTLGISTALDLVILAVFTRPVVFLMATRRILTRRSLRAEPIAAAAGGSR